jgi:hypothetical protein
MRARGRVEAVSSGRTCWFALRRPVSLSDVVLTNLWVHVVLIVCSGSAGVRRLLPRGLPDCRWWKLLPRGLPDRRGH